MSDEKVIEILRNFKEFLTIGDFVSDAFRYLGWVFVMGLSFIVDGMESVTNQMLLVKGFFQNPEVVAFTDSIRPLLFVLLAFSLLFSGYLLIFQRKIQAETIAVNLIIAISIIVLLEEGMGKVNDFTDESVTVVNNGQLFDSEEGTISENILSRNIQDVIEFDQGNFESTEPVQSIPYDMAKSLVVTEKLKGDEGVTIENEKVFENYVSLSADGEGVLTKLDQGGLVSYNDQYYYRYSVDWLTIIVTLAVMGFTLFSIAYKLARLSFELVFNQLLVTILAPIDVHDGQKTKKILQNIINIFIVIILIFLSMKLYVIGTSFLENNFDGLIYLIALIGFSVALIDGPNVVERLFGIDAGLKNGWGVAAGGYTAYKGLKGAAGLASNLGNKASSGNGDKKNGKDGGKKAQGEGSEEDGISNNGLGNQSPLANTQQKSPFSGKGINTGIGVNGVAVNGIGENGLNGNGDGDNQSSQITGKEGSSEIGKNSKKTGETINGNNTGSPSSINTNGSNEETLSSAEGSSEVGGNNRSPTDRARSQSFQVGMNETIDQLRQGSTNSQVNQSDANVGSSNINPTSSPEMPNSPESTTEQQTMNNNRQAVLQVNANDSINQTLAGSTNSPVNQSGGNVIPSNNGPTATPEAQSTSESTTEQQTVNNSREAARQVNVNDSVNQTQQVTTNSQVNQSNGNVGSTNFSSSPSPETQSTSENVSEQQMVNNHRQNVRQVNQNNIQDNFTESRQHTLNRTSKHDRLSRMRTIGKQRDNEE